MSGRTNMQPVAGRVIAARPTSDPRGRAMSNGMESAAACRIIGLMHCVEVQQADRLSVSNNRQRPPNEAEVKP